MSFEGFISNGPAAFGQDTFDRQVDERNVHAQLVGLEGGGNRPVRRPPSGMWAAMYTKPSTDGSVPASVITAPPYL